MRSMKKTAVRLIIFLIVSAMMLSIVSCKPNKDEHEHNYTKEVVAPPAQRMATPSTPASVETPTEIAKSPQATKC